MSTEQLKSINTAKLGKRARAHGRRMGGITPDARAQSWMVGYIACLADVRKVASGGGTPPDVADNIHQWLEEQP